MLDPEEPGLQTKERMGKVNEELCRQIAVVTGAASGIGLALAEKLARENMQVSLADVERKDLNLLSRTYKSTSFV